MAKNGKEKIVSTAFQLFLQNGYRSVSLKNIMEATQLSKGAIYHHFESKHSIYLAALEEYFFKMLNSISTEDDDLDFMSRIKLRYKTMAQTIASVESLCQQSGHSFPIRTFFIFQLESEKDDTVRKKIKKAIELYRQEIIAIVQMAIDRGEITLDVSADVIAYQIIGMVEGLAIHHSTIEDNGARQLMDTYNRILGPYLNMLTKQVPISTTKKTIA